MHGMLGQNNIMAKLTVRLKPFGLNIFTQTIFTMRLKQGNPFGSKSRGKLQPRSYPIQFERKWKHSCLSACSDKPLLWRNLQRDSTLYISHGIIYGIESLIKALAHLYTYI